MPWIPLSSTSRGCHEREVAARLCDLLHEGRHEDLAALRQARDPSRDHDVLTDQVSRVVDEHLAGVQADPDPDGAVRLLVGAGLEVLLEADREEEGLAGAPEAEHEAVAQATARRARAMPSPAR